MKRYVAIVLCVCRALPGLHCEERSWRPAWQLLWAGSAALNSKSDERGGILSNRGDLRIEPFPSFRYLEGFSLRAQVLDRRNLPVLGESEEGWEAMKEGTFAPGGALYYKPWGSRLLYGPLEEYGLPARVKNVWSKAPPFAENHKPTLRDLKTTPTASKNNEGHLYLALPRLDLARIIRREDTEQNPWVPSLTGFFYANIDDAMNQSYGGGLESRWANNTRLSLEAFSTGKTLSPRRPSTWFSQDPPLPERDFVLNAGNLTFTSPWFDLATDWAVSETFAFGRGLYGNLGLRGSFKSWKISLAGDGASGRFVGRDGAAPGEALRLAAKAEWRGKRNSFFRGAATFRTSALDSDFTRSSTSFLYRFPAPSASKTKGKPFFFRVTKISFTMERDARKLQDVQDSFEALAGFGFGPLGAAFSENLTFSSKSGHVPQPFPVPAGDGIHSTAFYSLKVSGELSWYPARFQFRTKADWVVDKKGDALWNLSLYGSYRHKSGYFSCKITLPKLPETKPQDLTYTLSWNLKKK